ncbi:hypothetical protein AB835_00290 [Candidatus Endobugula sertula]|uniref:Uncharacterized protein n=1 Tax=Candidatus Endobugula sertula TaxID=62101 RepID=A0A1D2QTS0_9GAMM|nr:hypothetical protein AB835_00290 [Candidatus Endobugula sertula]
MSDSTSSVDPFFDDVDESIVDDMDAVPSDETPKHPLNLRRRLENRLAERYLEKDVREFDFDL